MKFLHKCAAFGTAMLIAGQVSAQTLSPGFSAGTYAYNGASFVENTAITSVTDITATFMEGSAGGMPDMCEIEAVSGPDTVTEPEGRAQFF